MTETLFRIYGLVVLNILLLFYNDHWLWIFSVLVYYVCGVPWELQHWRKGQEFMNGSEEKG